MASKSSSASFAHRSDIESPNIGPNHKVSTSGRMSQSELKISLVFRKKSSLISVGYSGLFPQSFGPEQSDRDAGTNVEEYGEHECSSTGNGGGKQDVCEEHDIHGETFSSEGNFVVVRKMSTGSNSSQQKPGCDRSWGSCCNTTPGRRYRYDHNSR